ncbi:hypothetical protein SP19_167 [Salmonella phage 19]|nr:hypothetical protein SP19_167 [Salmonella phage 19]
MLNATIGVSLLTPLDQIFLAYQASDKYRFRMRIGPPSGLG